MLGRYFGTETSCEEAPQRGFDSYELRLGDIMRGERATLGKSLLDVQRELRIKAAYIAAIEDCDPSAFETPGFIAGYVRSYARYLKLDPEETFAHFCAESGFSGVHGTAMSETKSEKAAVAAVTAPVGKDVIADARGPFAPPATSAFSGIEPGALGSIAVLMLLVGGIGFGGWTVLQEIQRVQVAPVEEAPFAVAELVDPLSAAIDTGAAEGDVATASVMAPPSVEALDRLYRPEALDVPVLVARDAPISTLTPGAIGALAQPDQSGIQTAAATQTVDPVVPQVVAETPDEVVVFAVRPAWIRITAADGSLLFEKILDAGESYAVPQTEVPPSLHAGNSGSVYFQLNGETFGPAGPGTSVARGVALAAAPVMESYQVADMTADRELATVVAQLALPDPLAESATGE